MVIILNSLLTLIVIMSIAGAYRLRKAWPLVVGIAAIIVYMQLQPSYLPKGEVKRSDIPAFDQSEAEIEDRNSKPKSGEEYDKKMENAVKSGLPFKQD